jgi:cytochrome c-type protein NapB
MNKIMMAVLAAAGAVSLGYGALQAEGVVLVDDQMGLSKTSVFEDPSPPAFDYPATDPSASGALPRAWEGAPPQIPHNIADFLPINAESNQCIRCHDKPAMMGKRKVKGIPTPMPESHYVKADDGKLSRAGSRHVCTQCHAPQAEVGDLVGNTF